MAGSSATPKRSTSRIAKRLVLLLVLFSSVITVATTLLQLVTDYRRDLSNIKGSIRLIDTSYLETITNSLWTFDDTQVSSQLDGLLRLPDMKYVAIAVNGDVRWSRGELPSGDTVTKTFPIVYVDDNRRVALGDLTVAASLDQVYERLYDKVLIILAGNAVKTFLVSAFLFFVVHALVTRRVAWLANAINQLDAESLMPDGALFSRNSAKQDELDELETAVRKMRESQLAFHQSLREREAQLDAIVNNAPVVISLKDTAGRYILVNSGWEKMYGFQNEDARGKLAEEVLPESLVQRTLNHDRDIIEFNRPSTIEQTVPVAGVDRVFLATKFPVLDSDGKTIGIGSISADITEREQAAQKIRTLNETLEQRVEERTATLKTAQYELLRKERLAALGELTGTVAHELRNPLGAVAAAAHVLRRKCAGQDADVEKALNIAARGIARCDNIITELLDFARAKGLQPVPTNLEDWLSALLAEQQLPAGVTLHHDPATKDVVACFDPEELRRAVINVVDNACQAMTTSGPGDGGSDGTGQLTVETRATAERVEIDVTDSGPGIPKDSLTKVLEPLYSTKAFGTGLGLPTVHRIMAEHGGGLEIDSEEGRGTRVTLWLQRQQETAAPARL